MLDMSRIIAVIFLNLLNLNQHKSEENSYVKFNWELSGLFRICSGCSRLCLGTSGVSKQGPGSWSSLAKPYPEENYPRWCQRMDLMYVR